MKIFSKYIEYEYNLELFIPEHIDEHTPVYYILDGSFYFYFARDTIRLQSLNTLKTKVEKAVVVGICHQADDIRERRFLDFTGPAESYIYPERMKDKLPPAVGGADKFHEFLEKECKPFIYKYLSFVPNKEVLFGHSLSGYYVLWTLLHHPESFQELIAISPSLWWNGQELLKKVRERKFPAAPGVFLAVGEQETMIIDDVKVMYHLLKERINKLDVYVGSEENHASIVPHVISRAFRFVGGIEEKSETSKLNLNLS
ncbi:alpha/beta hydrolase [Ureibacillus suwonensis]|uniref:Alpha/beta hydrolase n=1 Tax=Ureibacillus suwonensis TaxID=313007 RepID=A0ABW0R9I2_9BACL